MSTTNPFIIGQPLDSEYFVGHQAALSITLSRLGHASRGSTSVIGAGYTGRSSFLRYLTSERARQHNKELQPYWPVLWEATSDEDLSPQEFWFEIFSLAKQACKVDTVQQLLNETTEKANQRPPNMPELRRVVDQIGQTGNTLLLAIDDFDYLLNHPNFTPPKNMQFFERLRHLCQRASHGLAMIMTTTRPLKDLWKFPRGSIFYNIFANAPLGPLSDDEVDELLDRLLKNTDIKFSKDDVVEIRTRSANLPVYVQYYAGLLYDAHMESYDTAQRKAFIQTALSQPDNMHTHLNRHLIDRMNPAEKGAFTKLAENSELTNDDKNLLQVLRSRGGIPPGVTIP